MAERGAIYAVLFTYLSLLGVRAENCKLREGSTCICDLDDGSGRFISLMEIGNHGSNPKPFFTGIKNGRYTYAYNPCTPFTETKCTNNVAVCQVNSAVCGRQQANSVAFDMTPNPPTLTYTQGDKVQGNVRMSIIKLKCDTTQDHKLTMDTEKPSEHYQFTLTSKYACLQTPPPSPTTKPPPPHDTTQPQPPGPTQPQPPGPTEPQKNPRDNPIGIGTIMDITALLLVVTYLSVGISFMYFKRGARGKEVLPNFEFWMAVPGLIKEGSMFIFLKVKGLRGGGGGYEQL